ncbi:MAG: DUF1269 domain-containing protein [Candidatus Obscuribacterales bacterium]|nr:DUF1269 domain-containing protein [Candidatus Obscuribacterales bacterium]
MTTLTVWKFDTTDGATKALNKLGELQKESLVEVVDAAVVTWRPGHKKPSTHQLVPTISIGALDGAFWGMLFGFLFFMPLIGAAMGTLIGGLSGHFADYGINDEFIKKVRGEITEGKSALFLLTGRVTEDKVLEAFKGMEKGELIKSNLTNEQEKKLRQDYSAEPAKAGIAVG